MTSHDDLARQCHSSCRTDLKVVHALFHSLTTAHGRPLVVAACFELCGSVVNSACRDGKALALVGYNLD